jgi:hypothetical protein
MQTENPVGIRSIVLITPVLDDWASFKALITEISNQFTGSELNFHVCAIDDGSIKAVDLHRIILPSDTCIDQIEVVHLALNLGHQRAIAVGLCEIVEREHIDAAIIMDSDGEDRPIDIRTLLSVAQRHPGHIVLAERAKRSETATFRFGYFLYKVLFRVMTGLTINFGNYSLLPRPAVRRLVYMPELWNHLAASVIRSRFPYRTVPTIRGARYHGESSMNLVTLIVHGLSAMSVNTDLIFSRVLLGASLIGVLSAVGIAVVAAIRFLTDAAIPGWATTVAGDLLIILLQTFVTLAAVTLIMLAGRSNRPIVPILDYHHYVAGREFWRSQADAYEYRLAH